MKLLGVDDVRRIAAQAFEPVGSDGFGLEMEWLVFDRVDPTRPVSVDEVRSAVSGAELPYHGSITYEPGGQLELSSKRYDGPEAALDALEADASVLRVCAEQEGLVLEESGFDTFRAPMRSLDLPRYRAMEAAFDAHSPAGRQMMCSTASLQINMDFGADPWRTWTIVSALSPLLAAVFANSPAGIGSECVASKRSVIWSEIDPTRTRQIPTGSLDDWLDYALDARVLLIRTADDATPLTDGTTLRNWVTNGHPLGFPDADDVRYHLTTLFPPVRPRGWLELRMIDAVSPEARRVAVGLASVLVDPTSPMVELASHCEAHGDLWPLVRFGLADPFLRQRAIELFELAAAELDRVSSGLASNVMRWMNEMVLPGRTPADATNDR